VAVDITSAERSSAGVTTPDSDRIILSRTARRRHILGERISPGAAGVLSFALVVYYSFNAGGFFPDSPAIVAVTALVLLAARAVVAERPLAGLGRGAVLASCALAALGSWTLLSAVWSGAPGRAMLEGNRVLAYLLVLLAFATFPYRPGRLRAIARGVALAIIVVCVAALSSRLAPDVFPTAPNVFADRLSFPLTYWNALALLAAIGVVLCVALACDLDEPWAIRIGAAAAVPCLSTTALLTFSRGGLAVGLIALALALLLGRPRGTTAALAAITPPTAVALIFAYRARLLATTDPTSGRAAAEGHRVAVVVLLATLGAAGLLYLADRRLAGANLRRQRLPSSARVVAALLALALLAAPLYQQVRHFARAPAYATASDARARLTDPSSNGRLDYWRAALDGFEREPLHGTGAGTYQLTWWRFRDSGVQVMHAHSLYLETLSELGVAGLLLVIAVLAAPIAGLARRIEGTDRVAAAALLACALAWAMHAALDWDWQVPAVTGWLFAAGGAALARPAGRDGRGPPALARATLGAALLCIAAGPALIAISERRIETALGAYERGDCARTAAAAQTANRAFPLRAEPQALRAACAARAGHYAAAINHIDDARSRDPGSWEYRYELAIVRAAAGRDPRPEIQAALALNPREQAVHAAAASFAGADRMAWKRGAASAPLYIDGLTYPPLGG
jgi:O-antigen ligase